MGLICLQIFQTASVGADPCVRPSFCRSPFWHGRRTWRLQRRRFAARLHDRVGAHVRNMAFHGLSDIKQNCGQAIILMPNWRPFSASSSMKAGMR